MAPPPPARLTTVTGWAAELFLFDDALDEPGLDVAAPAGCGVADEFDGLGQWTLGLGADRRNQEKG